MILEGTSLGLEEMGMGSHVQPPSKKIWSISYHEIIGVFICWYNLLYKNRRVLHRTWHFIQSFTDPYQKWKGVWPQPHFGDPFIFVRGLWNSVWNVMPCVKPFCFCIVNCINIWKPLWFHDKILIKKIEGGCTSTCLLGLPPGGQKQGLFHVMLMIGSSKKIC